MNLINKTLAAAASAVTVTLAAQAETAAGYTVERVTFESNGETLVGDFYVPTGVTAEAPAPAAVVTGAWATIKEQMAGRYAAELASRGTPALAFDFRTWGESGGDTRSLENPAVKIADIEAAAAYLASRADVSGVNGLGICASAGYMATAAERSDVLDRVALVAPWLHDAAIVEAVYGGADGVAGLIHTGRAAAAREAEIGEPQLIPAAGPAGSDALMAFDGYYTDPARGAVAAWENTFNLASWEGWLTFDAVRAAPGVTQPTLIVHSHAAAIPQGAEAFYAALAGEKAAVWLEDVTQFDFYHQDAAVAAAADAVADHFAG